MNYKTFIVILFVFGLGINNSYADKRNFIWSYEYMILEPNTAELEQYTTMTTTDRNDFENTTSTQLQLETEIGMTKHVDFALYTKFAQSPAGSFKYDGFKLRSRFLIGEKNQYFMDPLVYVEYEGKPGFTEHAFETKLILAKEIGSFKLTLNPYFELEKEKGEDEWEFTPKYSLGLGYSVSDIFNVGLEAMGSKDGNYVGPTLSHGTHRIWGAVGCLWGVGNITIGKPEYQFRMIVGVGI